ncbi:MAG: hypothetical protein DKM50_05480 [Candidatus Margulisiibacteriota bacterium]|nr:MAG: hypothetical protein A2X42_06355 [Candidatus Margulisbacteria bacterium GWF2_38_17]OGI05631.1 MAG: hypothetical protein A2X41_12835 [Candidatus Margulisbacteria bacterium GWE2_39_32]PZM80217.1 MAG: hypothetical protein DKM50_05480 [Candidatus Margulisiibacteriota bacterium]HCT84244.1 hypothetical protein [Candidatus Margulisiibacteriota bacterium]HCY36914.1 hypothetical protein [Candidatus Margulisiibacteriota bacterium]
MYKKVIDAKVSKIKVVNEFFDVKEVKAILGKIAHRIYLDSEVLQLRRFMSHQFGINSRALTLEEFKRIYVGDHLLKIGFSGPTNPSKEKIEEQSEAVSRIIGSLSNRIGAVVHGGTMWAFIRAAHIKAIEKQKLSIGVMPWVGISDLLKIKDEIPENFPKMDYLAITGQGYEDHANIFAKALDFLVLMGGRSGALAEAVATTNQSKHVISLMMGNEQDEAFQVFKNGIWYTDKVDEIAEFVENNLIPSQQLFKGRQVALHDFLKNTHDKIRVGFAGNTGRKTDLGLHNQILSGLIDNIRPSFFTQMEAVSGMTNVGGVRAYYEMAKENNISRSGIMSSKGIGYKLADCDNMVVWGNEWGSESNIFLSSSDVLLVLGGGDQTAKEAEKALVSGGRFGSGIPVIAIHDPLVGNWSYDSFNSMNGSKRLSRAEYFSSSQLFKAAQRLNEVFESILLQRNKRF